MYFFKNVLMIGIIINNVSCTTFQEQKEIAVVVNKIEKVEKIVDIEKKVSTKVPPPITVQASPVKKIGKNIPNITDPLMPEFNLKIGETVFVIKSLECKSTHKAFVLFYEGDIQALRDRHVSVKIQQRYALSYDTHQTGVSKIEWWCVPSQRFCYSRVNFTNWDGILKKGDIAPFLKALTIPSRFDITTLVSRAAKQSCSF